MADNCVGYKAKEAAREYLRTAIVYSLKLNSPPNKLNRTLYTNKCLIPPLPRPAWLVHENLDFP
jgi:hypothetical protein